MKFQNSRCFTGIYDRIAYISFIAFHKIMLRGRQKFPDLVRAKIRENRSSPAPAYAKINEIRPVPTQFLQKSQN